jgi:hypothetical protein
MGIDDEVRIRFGPRKHLAFGFRQRHPLDVSPCHDLVHEETLSLGLAPWSDMLHGPKHTVTIEKR